MYGHRIETGNRPSVTSRSSRKLRGNTLFPPRRIVSLLVLAFLARGTILRAPSVSDFATTDHLRGAPAGVRNQHGVFPEILPGDWRSWLAQHNHTEPSIQKLEIPSQQTDWGCGVSVQFVFETKQSHRLHSSPIPSFTKTFFKVSHADMTHYDAESHLREIKAYYLDRILQTNVVLPCAGFFLDREQIANHDEWHSIEHNMECVGIDNQKPPPPGESGGADEPAANTKTKSTVQGSMMLWMNDLHAVPREQIVEASKKGGTDAAQQASAMNYALFHYLGACMKSEHNHFSSHQRSGSYVAIDNDRCLTPKAIFSDRKVVPDFHFRRIELWETLVYETICDLPHHKYPVIQVVLEASSSSTSNSSTTTSTSSSTTNPEKNSSISSRLIRELQVDELAPQLLESQPEAFSEIDERVNRLAQYIREHCPAGAQQQNA